MLPKIKISRFQDNSKMEADKRLETKIEFPEIEQVSKNGEIRPYPGLKPGAAKNKFTNIALKLMTSLYTTDEDVQEEEAEQGTNILKRADPVENRGLAANGRRRSISRSRGSIVELETGRPQQAPLLHWRRPHKSRFVSLVRNYRKLTRPRGGSVSSDVSSIGTVDEEMIDLPEEPRFCATLSPEAQYAMMKGYEDLLLTSLKKQEENAAKMRLCRVKTPHHKVVSVHLNSLEKKQEEILREFEAQRLTKRHSNPWFDHTDSRSSLPPVKTPSHDDTKSWFKVPKDKQLWLTHRFQCAMDILDKIREEQGLLVTSPRYKQREINPVANYNSWSHDWSREFKLEYTKK